MITLQAIINIIAIDLSKQIEIENPDLKQQINFMTNSKKIMEQQCFSSLKNQKKQILSIMQNGSTKDYKFVE